MDSLAGPDKWTVIGIGLLVAASVGYLATKYVVRAPARTAEEYLNLSLQYSRAGRFQESLDAAAKAIQLKPDYAEAYNNEAAAYEDLHRWDEAIAAAQQALRLQSGFQLARNNLIYAVQQKGLKK
jgi:Flp pilus assembly protein TadD